MTVRICPPSAPPVYPEIPDVELGQKKNIPKEEALKLIELALANSEKKVKDKFEEKRKIRTFMFRLAIRTMML